MFARGPSRRRRQLIAAVLVASTAAAVAACQPAGGSSESAATSASTAPPALEPAASGLSAEPPSAAPEPPIVACADIPAVEPLPATDEEVQPAVDGILDLFAEAPVVAIGEIHGWAALHDVLGQVICDPGFPDIVDAVVVEFGNRRLQDVLDRYVVAGEAVSRAELQSVWRESTQRSGVWDHPVYERFFSLLRSINLALPADRRVRVLAGDPPIDWAMVTKFGECSSDDPTCADHWLFGRDESFADVVNEVLASGQTALLIAGLGHMLPRGEPPLPPSIPELVEAATSAHVQIVIPHTGLGAANAEPERTIRSWPTPSLVSLAGTWLGELDGCLIEGADPEPSAPPCPDGAGPTLADLADAYLYLGPR